MIFHYTISFEYNIIYHVIVSDKMHYNTSTRLLPLTVKLIDHAKYAGQIFMPDELCFDHAGRVIKARSYGILWEIKEKMKNMLFHTKNDPNTMVNKETPGLVPYSISSIVCSSAAAPRIEYRHVLVENGDALNALKGMIYVLQKVNPKKIARIFPEMNSSN